MASSSSTVPSASEEVIDRLLDNVDVWQTICEMLSVKDRIRVEMTNKRLGMMMLEYWKRVTSFDTQCYTDMNYDSSMSCDRENLSEALVTICVKRIGDGLRSLTIREYSASTVCSDHLASIGEGCPNVETINFVFEEYGTLDIRFDSFYRLKTITVSSRYRISASPSVFLSILVSIEVIRGLEADWREPFENAAEVEGFFADRPSLREVDLYCLNTSDKRKADMFRVIAERCSHLKSIKLSSVTDIDYHGVIALESMKELRMHDAILDEMEIVTICARSPLVEALELRSDRSSNLHLQSPALNALGALTKLCELHIWGWHWPRASSFFTEFVRELARNSGASLRHLLLDPCNIPLSTAAIEALANGCPKLRYLDFAVCVGEVEPASIRFLIDSIVAHPSWIHETGEPTLIIRICMWLPYDREGITGYAAFSAAAPLADLPAGVQLDMWIDD